MAEKSLRPIMSYKNCKSCIEFVTSILSAQNEIKAYCKLIARKYINIDLQADKGFTSINGLYQITSGSVSDKGKVVVAKRPNEYWGVHLIDCQTIGPKNARFRYILVVADLYSKIIFIRALKDKTNLASMNVVLEHILEKSLKQDQKK
ncbi:hypothetical protein EON65_22900 [archaeon]|nr:MAG: hypothetical protein EON65_22900 [archaeon]